MGIRHYQQGDIVTALRLTDRQIGMQRGMQHAQTGTMQRGGAPLLNEGVIHLSGCVFACVSLLVSAGLPAGRIAQCYALSPSVWKPVHTSLPSNRLHITTALLVIAIAMV